MVYCGIDWSARHHDIALVDEHGCLVAKGRVGDDVEGFTALVTLGVAQEVRPRRRAVVLANILRTDAYAHRPLPHNSELVQTVAVAASQQDSSTIPARPFPWSVCPRPPLRGDTGRLGAHERRQGLVRLA